MQQHATQAPTMTDAAATTLVHPGSPTPALRVHGEPLTVLIADDHAHFREGMARAVARESGMTLVGEAVDGREALALIAALEPDVAVLDHRMPELTGVEVCAQLALQPDRPKTAVLLLSAFEDVDIVCTAVDAGAAGYVGKGASQTAILHAVHCVGRGGIAYVGDTVAGVNESFRRRLGGRPR